MRLSKAEYEDMIQKKPSLKPTEMIKSQNIHKTALEAAAEVFESKGSLGPIQQENVVKSFPTLKMKPSNDEAKLNKTERAWLDELRIRNPKFLGVQSMTFKLGDDCRYTPDFVEISQEDKFIAWEVKGFMRDDALVKLKVAARMFPFLDFYIVKRIKGSWETKKVNP